MNISTIEQGITAGSDFDGTLPLGTPVRANDLIRYVAEAAGGLFDPGIVDPSEIYHIEIKLGGQTSWTLHKKDANGVEILLWAGTTEANFATVDSDRMPILEKQTLLLRTTGATGDMKARVSTRSLR